MKKRQSAFTLVEMLVALAVTSVLVVLLVNVVSAALTVWQQGRNQVDTFANARQILGRIADEISGARASASPLVVEFSENLTSLQGTTAPVPKTSENVFFVAPYPNAKSGDLCVIAYRHNNDTRTLERGFIDSHDALTGDVSPTSTPTVKRYQSSLYPGSNAMWKWRTIATGVLEFEIQSYSQQDLDASSPSPTPTDSWASATSTPAGNTPRQVVIRIKVIDDRNVVKLAGLSVGNPTYDRVVAQAAREFRGSVMLPAPQ